MKSGYIFVSMMVLLLSVCNTVFAKTVSMDGKAIEHSARIEKKPEAVLVDEAKKTTESMFVVLRKYKALYKKEPEEFYSKVKDVLNKVVAFEAVARGVMGKYSHRVSQHDFENFVTSFKHSLIVFYSKVLQNYDTGNLKVVSVTPPYPEQMDSYNKGSSLSVPVNIIIGDGKNTYQVSYSMMKVQEKWKIRNIIVEGINIGIQFRNQFAEAINVYDTPQRVILNWHRIIENKPVKDNGPKPLVEKS